MPAMPGCRPMELPAHTSWARRSLSESRWHVRGALYAAVAGGGGPRVTGRAAATHPGRGGGHLTSACWLREQRAARVRRSPVRGWAGPAAVDVGLNRGSWAPR